jgi:hypothetical protein
MAFSRPFSAVSMAAKRSLRSDASQDGLHLGNIGAVSVEPFVAEGESLFVHNQGSHQLASSLKYIPRLKAG